MLEICPIICEAPSYPDSPFGSGALVFFDALRVMVALAALLYAPLVIWAMHHKRPLLGQAIRFLTNVGFLFIIFGTEVSHLGDWANWRLFFTVACLVGAYWGLWSYVRWELAPVYRTDRGE